MNQHGEMSLVRPRPPLRSEVERFPPELLRRLSVKPGITARWQGSGRADLSWDEVVRVDLLYIETWSLTLDALILLQSVPAVLGGTGAY